MYEKTSECEYIKKITTTIRKCILGEMHKNSRTHKENLGEVEDAI